MRITPLTNIWTTIKNYYKNSPAVFLLMLIGVGIVATPIIILCALLVTKSVNIPFWDQVSFVDLMTKSHNGTLGFHDVWVQHNEHRIMVPQIMELAMGKFTNYNFRYQVMANWMTAVVSFWFIVFWLRKTFKNWRLVTALAIPISWLMFSTIQWTNWIWGFQLAFFMSVCLTIITITLLSRERILASKGMLLSAIGLAALTTYCNGNGLIIWAIGLGILLYRRASWRLLAAWCIAALFTLATYFYKFHRGGDSLPLSQVAHRPKEVFDYVCMYLGKNLAYTADGALYTGLALLILFTVCTVIILRKRQFKSLLVWYGLAAYVLVTSILAAVSRLNFGPKHGFISNSYPTFSLLFVVATIVIMTQVLRLWLKNFRRSSLWQYLVVFSIIGALVIMPIQSFIKNYANGTENLRLLSAHMMRVKHCINTATSPQDECLSIVYPDTDYGWDRIKQLRELHWGDF